MNKRKVLMFFLYSFFCLKLFSDDILSFDFLSIYKSEKLTVSSYENLIFEADKREFFKTYESYYDFERYKYEKKEELLLRRAEILFFGSLTFVTFGSWFFFSLFNTFVYNEPFGKIRREQFLPMILGSGTISIAVVLTDVFTRIKPQLDEKKIELYEK